MLWQAKRRILATVFAFARGCFVLSAAAKWTSRDCHTGGVGTVAGAGENVDRAARVDMEVSADRAAYLICRVKSLARLAAGRISSFFLPYVMDH